MTRLRISLAGLFGAILFCAVIFAALRSASMDWFKSIYTLTFIVLLYGTIAARYRGAFWYGFAIVGSAYFVFGFRPWIGKYPYETNRHLLTSSVIDAVSTTLDPEPPAPRNDRSAMEARQILLRDREPRLLSRDGICHSFLTICFAIVGGIVSKYLESRSLRQRDQEPP
jgi:hypothetical protein